MDDLNIVDANCAASIDSESQWSNVLANIMERQSTTAAQEASTEAQEGNDGEKSPCKSGVDESALNELSNKGEILAKSSAIKKDTFKGDIRDLTVAPRRLEELQKLCTGDDGVQP